VIALVLAQVAIPNPCKGLSPSDWEYWLLGCWAMRTMLPLVVSSVTALSLAALLRTTWLSRRPR
jgi:hypothetical protein